MGAPGRWISLAAAALIVGGLVGCASPATGTTMPTGAKVDYQLGGSYPPPSGVQIVTRDSTSKPAPGLYNICYINGFQTQDEDKSFWLTKHPTLVLRYSTGMHKTQPVFDPGWPNEMILDASTAAKRDGIAAVQDATIDLCKSKGFNAVEFDNLDSYSRSHRELTLDDDIALAKLLVAHAHADGLAAGQKNTTELGSRGKTIDHYDFAVAEECHTYNECSSYTKVYGAHVIDIEYTDDLHGTFASICADRSQPRMTILRDRDLTTPTSKHYVYKAC